MKKRVLHVIDTLDLGGAEKLLAGYVDSLTDFEHFIICFRKDGQLESEIKNAQIIIIPSSPSFSNPLQLLFLVFTLRKQIRTIQPDIIHSHLFWSNILTRFAKKKSINLINSYHSIQYGKSGADYPIWYQLLDKLTCHKCNLILAVSKVVENNFKEFISKKTKTSVLLNYIDDRFFERKALKISASPHKIVSIGTLKKQKNYAASVKLLSRGLTSYYTWDIYGTGPEKELINKIIDIEKSKNIKLKGFTHDSYETLTHYDIFLFPSLNEGFGLSLVEAMSSGLVCIASNLTVFKEIAGESILYFDLDKPNTLIQTLEKIQKNEIDIKRLIHKAVKKSKGFQKKEYLKELNEIYHNLSTL